MSDWSPLALSDPVPGDPGAVTALSGTLRSTADAIHSQTDRLRAVRADGFWSGDAARVFTEHQAAVPPRLGTLSRRYAAVSTALGRYAPHLGDAQATARRALSQARQAEADIHHAQQGIAQMQAHAQAATAAATSWNDAHPDQPPASPVPWTGPDYPAMLARAQADMDAARRLLDRAVAQRDDAARACATAIRHAVDDALADGRGFWNGVKRVAGHLNDLLPAIAHGLGVATAVVGIAAMALPVLTPIAAGLAVASLVVNTTLAAQHRGSWTTVALDAIAVASFGAGHLVRVAGAAERVATSGSSAARALVTDTAEELEGSSLAARARLGTIQPGVERTLENSLDKNQLLREVAERYGINLRGSGRTIEAVFDSRLPTGTFGMTKTVEGGLVIRVGPSALVDDPTLANTLAHELSHARYLLKNGTFAGQIHGTAESVADGTPYGSGNALEEWVNGKR